MQIDDSHLDSSKLLLDLLAGTDPTIQKSIMRLKLLHPTYLQSQLFSLPPEKLASKRHFYLSSSLKSGKTVAIAIFLINHLLENHIKAQKTVPKTLTSGDSEIPVGIFAVFLCPSRENCLRTSIILQELLHFVEKPYKLMVRNLMDTPKINLMPNFNYIVVATPTVFLSFQRNLQLGKELFKALVLEDAEFLRSFGYYQELAEIKGVFAEESGKIGSDMLAIISSSQEIDEDLKSNFLRSCVKISVEDPAEDDLSAPLDLFSQQISQINQIFHTGPYIHKYALLYLSFKLKLIFGKTVILCRTVEMCYRMELFLKRTGIQQTHIYNPKDPKNLRSYIVSVFNSGLLQTIITTPEFFKDLQNLKTLQKANTDTGEKVWKKVYLKNLQNIIIFDFACLREEGDYLGLLERLFRTRSSANKTLISLIESKEEEIDMFTRVFEKEKTLKNWNLREFPLKTAEIDAFNYRISDVVLGISKKQVQQAQMLDFKRQMLKSKKLESYFISHPEEKRVLQEEIKRISNDLNKFAVRLYEDIPDYLFPESLREKSMTLNTLTGKKRKIVLGSWNEEFEQSLKKRMENNGLTLDDVKKKVQASEKKMVIDENEEKPELMDENNLRPLSNRKLWKLRHKFKLRKRNKRLEKKGIFQA